MRRLLIGVDEAKADHPSKDPDYLNTEPKHRAPRAQQLRVSGHPPAWGMKVARQSAKKKKKKGGGENSNLLLKNGSTKRILSTPCGLNKPGWDDQNRQGRADAQPVSHDMLHCLARAACPAHPFSHACNLVACQVSDLAADIGIMKRRRSKLCRTCRVLFMGWPLQVSRLDLL